MRVKRCSIMSCQPADKEFAAFLSLPPPIEILMTLPYRLGATNSTISSSQA